jgi:hypothetical protein
VCISEPCSKNGPCVGWHTCIGKGGMNAEPDRVTVDECFMLLYTVCLKGKCTDFPMDELEM